MSPLRPSDPRTVRLRREGAYNAHRRHIFLIARVSVKTVAGLAFLARVFVLVINDKTKTLTVKTIGITTAIVAAIFGYLTGKGRKQESVSGPSGIGATRSSRHSGRVSGVRLGCGSFTAVW